MARAKSFVALFSTTGALLTTAARAIGAAAIGVINMMIMMIMMRMNVSEDGYGVWWLPFVQAGVRMLI
jgi:hypothetical protein